MPVSPYTQPWHCRLFSSAVTITTKSKLVRKQFILAYIVQPILKNSQGTWRQELNPKAWRSSVCWLIPSDCLVVLILQAGPIYLGE